MSASRPHLKILLHGLNYAPEELGIGKYSGEMMQFLAARGHQCAVVTTPPYYPQWQIHAGFSGSHYRCEQEPVNAVTAPLTNDSEAPDRATPVSGEAELPTPITVIRCPLWVPKKVTGLRRVIHLASFGLSSVPAVLFQAMRQRPDVILTVEPAAFCLPTTWLAARLCGAKAWLHVQDFEVDAAFDLGILKSASLRRVVLTIERFWIRRFDRVSTISPNMLRRLVDKGGARERTCYFPNWVDCDTMRPLSARELQPDAAGTWQGTEARDQESAHDQDDESAMVESLRIDSPHLSERLPKLRAQFGIPVDSVVAMYAGSIGAKQGLEIVLEAARTLAAAPQANTATPAVHFVICGHGAAHAEIAAAAAGLSSVQMLPVQPLERLNELLNCTDIHLLPQRADAADLVMPSKLTGMLATGRPVVACAAAGTQIADVVMDCGLVVPPGDAGAFAAAIAELAASSARRRALGAAARQYAVEYLGREAILGRFEAELQALVASQARPLSVEAEPMEKAGGQATAAPSRAESKLTSSRL